MADYSRLEWISRSVFPSNPGHQGYSIEAGELLHFMLTKYKLPVLIFLELDNQIFEERVEHYLSHEKISPEVYKSDLFK